MSLYCIPTDPDFELSWQSEEAIAHLAESLGCDSHIRVKAPSLDDVRLDCTVDVPLLQRLFGRAGFSVS